MSEINVTLKNYRAFSQQFPTKFSIAEGITFLLGVNNVGKSTLLKFFYEFRSGIQEHHLVNAISSQQTWGVNLNQGITFDRLAHRVSPSGPIEVTFEQGGSGWNLRIQPPEGQDAHTPSCHIIGSGFGKPTRELARDITEIFMKSMHVGSFRSPAVETTGTLFDIQIGKNFVHQWDSWANGERIDHSNQADILVEELRVLFGYQKFSITVSQKKDQLLVTTDDGKFSLGELGDGIAHYVVVLGNAMIHRPSYIFIDEPEIGLHPRMQEVFVRTLASKARKGLIATSHSVGLARSVADQILTITKNQNGSRKCVPFGEHRAETVMQSISELGYSQYAEIGGNHLLLVEGRTDIKAFREILRKFGIEQHFLIWSLNGSDWLTADPGVIVDELNEIKRLNARSYSIIFDSERTDSSMVMNPRFKPFYDLCLSLGFKVFPTDKHSTENYITQAALDAVLPNQSYKALTDFEVLGANGKKWPKNRNWLLFQKMKAEDFKESALEEFIVGTLKQLVGTTAQ